MLLCALARGRPQDLPWTPLDLAQPIGLFTGRKLAALTQDFPQCRALLDRAGVRYTVLAPTVERRAMRLCRRRAPDAGRRAARSRSHRAKLGIACPVAAALSVWEWDVVQPAARAPFRAARRRDRAFRQL